MAAHPLIELTKPRILVMQLVTVAIGFVLADQSILFPIEIFIATLLGTALVSAGSAALNHYTERHLDAQMKRTENRAIPAGRISPNAALIYGAILIILGVGLLIYEVNLLTAGLALLTAALYVLVYTPLKTRTWLNTFVGAIPGAIPPLGGWAAATNSIGMGAIILFLILFTWQHPHFFAIAIMYKEDYKKAGFKMLPSIDNGNATRRQILFYSCLMIATSFLPVLYHMVGLIYFVGMAIVNAGFFWIALKTGRNPDHTNARLLLRASLLYLPILLVLILV